MFENMKARLAAIASHTGMSKVFRLLGSDVYRVLEYGGGAGGNADVGHLSARGTALRPARLPGRELAGCADLAHLLDTLLEGLERHWDIRHAMLLMLDPDGKRLYTVASRGYAESGVGSEVRMGEGIVGVAASARTPIRIGYAVQEYRYSHATRQTFRRQRRRQRAGNRDSLPWTGGSG
jgi:adenylate cyclase